MESNDRSIVLNKILYDISPDFPRLKNERHVFLFPKSDVRASDNRPQTYSSIKIIRSPHKDVAICVRESISIITVYMNK